MRAVIAEGSVLLRVGLVKVLEMGGFQVVAEVGDAETLLAAVEKHQPELALVDVRMPPTFTGEGVRAAAVIRRGDPLAVLTPREREVLALMAEGRSNAGIAEALTVSESAVAKHINDIFARLDLPVADAEPPSGARRAALPGRVQGLNPGGYACRHHGDGLGVGPRCAASGARGC